LILKRSFGILGEIKKTKEKGSFEVFL